MLQKFTRFEIGQFSDATKYLRTSAADCHVSCLYWLFHGALHGTNQSACPKAIRSFSESAVSSTRNDSFYTLAMKGCYCIFHWSWLCLEIDVKMNASALCSQNQEMNNNLRWVPSAPSNGLPKSRNRSQSALGLGLKFWNACELQCVDLVTTRCKNAVIIHNIHTNPRALVGWF